MEKRIQSGRGLPTSAHIQAEKSLWVAACSGCVGFISRFVPRGEFVAMNRIEDLAPVYGHFLWGLNPKSDLISTNFDYHDRNVIVDDNTFVFLTRQH
jgi:hypothetical protein